MKNVVTTALICALSGGAMLAATTGCSKAQDPPSQSPTSPSPPPPPPSTTPAEPPPSPSPPSPPSPAAEPAMPTAPADPSAMSAATSGDRAFAVALHEVLRKQPGNLFFSPASVRLAMAMISMGARGETAAELSKGLGLPADATAAAAGFAAVLESFAQRSRPEATPQAEEWRREEALRKVSTVAIANRVWPQAGRPFEPAFADVMAKRFAAPMQPLDFAKNREAARKTINAWVAEQTAQKIPELLQPPNVPASTKLILTNAIYFKAQWEEPFVAQLTRDGEFTTDKGAKVKVPMMSRTDSLQYAETPDYQAVQLPYSDGSLSLTVLLPRAGKSLAGVEGAALAGALAGNPALMRQRVAVQLPRFKIEARFALAAVLAKLGMASAFQFGPADFSGIDGTRELFIGDVVHQAIIEVDEQGTEAAAATAIGMRAGSAAPTAPPKSFIADRPFAFFLKDARTGVVLFMGRVADPTAK